VLTLRRQQLPVKVVVFKEGSLALVELEMRADGIVNCRTDLDHPSLADVGSAVGLHAVRVEHPSHLDAGCLGTT
jgi:pyruvate dehydrogenase (quinone)